MPKNRSTSDSPTKYRQQSLLTHFSSSSPVVPRTRPNRVKTQVKQPSEQVSSETDSRLPLRRPRKRLKRTPSHDDSDSDTRGIKFVTATSSSESVDAADVPMSPSRQRPGTQRSRIIQSESEDGMSSDDSLITAKGKGKGKQKAVEQNESDSETAPRTRTRRLVKGTRPASEEKDDPLDGIDKDKIIEKRTRGAKKSAYMQNLEKLKKRKKGLAVSDSEEEESSGPDDFIPRAKPSVDEDDPSLSEEEADDFIVDDGDVVTKLPAAFSMSTYQDLAHHFKIVCQYFVHLAVTTEQARAKMADRLASDDYFQVSLMMARQKLGDLRDSLVSSVWRPEFKKALETYPEFDLVPLDFSVPHCDACRLTNRVSTLLGRLGGVPYNKKTFEAVLLEDSDTSDETSENDSMTSNAPQFNLGRFCARRTNLYHGLSHWEYEVFWSLYREVATLSGEHIGFVRAAAADVPPPDDISDADQVTEWLDSLNAIEGEWLKVKTLMTNAMNLEADAKRGDDDRS